MAPAGLATGEEAEIATEMVERGAGAEAVDGATATGVVAARAATLTAPLSAKHPQAVRPG